MNTLTIKQFTQYIQAGVTKEWKNKLRYEGIGFDISWINEDSVHPTGIIYIKPEPELDYIKFKYSFADTTIETAELAVARVCDLVRRLHSNQWTTTTDIMEFRLS